MRHKPNLRRNARGRPQRMQRFRLRIAYFSFEFALMIAARRAMPALLDMLSAERHSEFLQKNPGPVIRACRRDDGYVETLGLVDLRGVDLGKDEVVLDSERVIAAPGVKDHLIFPDQPAVGTMVTLRPLDLSIFVGSISGKMRWSLTPSV